MPFSHKNKNPAARITSKRQDFLTKKGISTANPSYVSRKFFFSHFLYIVYHIFRYTQIFNGFFQQNKSPGFFQGKMHFQAISGQIFQLFSNHFFRILIIFCFSVKINNFSGLRNLRDYLAFFIVISCLPRINEPSFLLFIKGIAPDFSPLALASGSFIQKLSDFLNHLMYLSSLSFLIFFVFFFTLLVHVRKV